MKTIQYLLIFCVHLLLIVACGDTSSTAHQHPANDHKIEGKGTLGKLNVADFQAKMEELHNEQLIDVRSIEELELTGKIANATNIDYYEDNFNAEIDKLDKNKPVMVYCKSGNRSGKTSKMLHRMHFKEVYDLEGGITDWISENKPIEKVNYD